MTTIDRLKQWRSRWTILCAISSLTLASDLLTKYWARTSLPVDPMGRGLSKVVIENFWEWRLAYNTGSAFSLFRDFGATRVLLTVIGLAAIVGIVWMAKRAADDSHMLFAALGLVLGGAVGNLYDRLTLGKVTDFIVWKYHSHEWPIFNVADVALCIGIALVFWDSMRTRPAANAAGSTA